MMNQCYGVATISRLPKIIGLFCRISLLQGSFAKETDNLKEPTNRSHPILRIHNSVVQMGTISRLLKIIRLFCKRALQKRRYSAIALREFSIF